MDKPTHDLSPTITINVNPDKVVTTGKTKEGSCPKKESGGKALTKNVFDERSRNGNEDEPEEKVKIAGASCILDEDTCLPKESAYHGSKGTVVHAEYVYNSGH